jgi:hypothetical protein
LARCGYEGTLFACEVMSLKAYTEKLAVLNSKNSGLLHGQKRKPNIFFENLEIMGPNYQASLTVLFFLVVNTK